MHSLDAIALRLYKMHIAAGDSLPIRDAIRDLLRRGVAGVGGHKFSQHFLLTEWEQVVDAWQLESWEAYRDVARLGRKTRLPEAQRASLWSIFEKCESGFGTELHHRGRRCSLGWRHHFAAGKNAPFDFAVVDEAQDLSVPQLRFLAAIWRQIAQMHCSLPATWGNASSSSRSPGSRSAWIFAAESARCG